MYKRQEYYYAWNKANDTDTVANGISSLFTMIEMCIRDRSGTPPTSTVKLSTAATTNITMSAVLHRTSWKRK